MEVNWNIRINRITDVESQTFGRFIMLCEASRSLANLGHGTFTIHNGSFSEIARRFHFSLSTEKFDVH